MNLIQLIVFGIMGVLCRYFIMINTPRNLWGEFPIGTFAINIIGSFLIGIVYVLGVEKTVISTDLKIALMVGFLGGFTTFSTFSLDAFYLFEQSQMIKGLLYFCLSPIIGLFSVYSGIVLSRWTLLYILK